MNADHKANILQSDKNFKLCGKKFQDQDFFLSHLIDMH